VSAAGIDPEQILCEAEILLFATLLLTEMPSAAEVSEHDPESATLLYQVLAVSAGGE
jgi:hypothetical protein